MAKVRFVSCPRCGAQVAWSLENPYRPFCSERCKLIDLGAWAMEKYRVPVEEDKDAPDAEGQDEGSGIRD
ncbi:MAG TPA: DNA gyrase inhibitor YacG [Burkholderiales bacterium]|nr:DNA gyrase inhibitor YacG [Burkholderiales bacterium]